MRNYIIKLPANEDIRVEGLNADYMRIIDGDARLTVTPDELQPLEGMQKGMSYRTPQTFNKLTLFSSTAQTVEIMIGFGNISDDRLNISGSIDASSNGGTIAEDNHTVGTSAAEILAADTSRRSAMIQNNSAGNVFIGSATVTTSNGLKLGPGETLTIDKAARAAIYAIGSGAGLDVRTLAESD